MLLWNLYFISKLGMHLGGLITLSPLLNLGLFALLIAIKQPTLRNLLLTGPAILLLLHELGLVVSLALVDQIKALSGFSLAYLVELIKRTIEPSMLWGLVAAFILIRVLDRYIRTSTWVGFGLLTLLAVQSIPFFGQQNQSQQANPGNKLAEPLSQARMNATPAELLVLGKADSQKLRIARNLDTQSDLDDENPNGAKGGQGPSAVLKDFFEQQRNRSEHTFTAKAPLNFDVIVLQICSLSWADLQQAKQTQHQAIRQADFVFENFNSATSYSGPAALRLLRGKCGQMPHDKLYRPANNNCMLFQQLRNVGFEIELGLNHDGLFDNFGKLIKNNQGGNAKERVAHNEVQAGVKAFDGSQVGRDGDYLLTWWKKRVQQSAPAVAYYYNSITLHDGNRLLNSNLNSLESYPFRLERMLNDILSVVAEIRRSKRKALLIVVPEHGAGLSGEYGQLVGLRELPTPAITKVPVFGYWIAPGYLPASTGPIRIKQAVSYSALSELLIRWVALPAEQLQKPAWPLLFSDLPSTRLVSQQGNITVIESQGSYWIKAPGTTWKVLGPVQ